MNAKTALSFTAAGAIAILATGAARAQGAVSASGVGPIPQPARGAPPASAPTPSAPAADCGRCQAQAEQYRQMAARCQQQRNALRGGGGTAVGGARGSASVAPAYEACVQRASQAAAQKEAAHRACVAGQRNECSAAAPSTSSPRGGADGAPDAAATGPSPPSLAEQGSRILDALARSQNAQLQQNLVALQKLNEALARQNATTSEGHRANEAARQAGNVDLEDMDAGYDPFGVPGARYRTVPGRAAPPPPTPRPPVEVPHDPNAPREIEFGKPPSPSPIAPGSTNLDTLVPLGDAAPSSEAKLLAAMLQGIHQPPTAPPTHVLGVPVSDPVADAEDPDANRFPNLTKLGERLDAASDQARRWALESVASSEGVQAVREASFDPLQDLTRSDAESLRNNVDRIAARAPHEQSKHDLVGIGRTAIGAKDAYERAAAGLPEESMSDDERYATTGRGLLEGSPLGQAIDLRDQALAKVRSAEETADRIQAGASEAWKVSGEVVGAGLEGAREGRRQVRRGVAWARDQIADVFGAER